MALSLVALVNPLKALNDLRKRREQEALSQLSVDRSAQYLAIGDIILAHIWADHPSYKPQITGLMADEWVLFVKLLPGNIVQDIFSQLPPKRTLLRVYHGDGGIVSYDPQLDKTVLNAIEDIHKKFTHVDYRFLAHPGRLEAENPFTIKEV